MAQAYILLCGLWHLQTQVLMRFVVPTMSSLQSSISPVRQTSATSRMSATGAPLGISYQTGSVVAHGLYRGVGRPVVPLPSQFALLLAPPGTMRAVLKARPPSQCQLDSSRFFVQITSCLEQYSFTFEFWKATKSNGHSPFCFGTLW